MIIRIKKIHLLIFATLIISVAFLFALKSEGISKSVSANAQLKLPVVMYHHITENEKKTGKYVISTTELENDLKYLKEKGYETVFVKDLIDYTLGEKELSDKVIMITFDDGFKSVYKLGVPLLKKYNMKAVVAAVGTITEEYTQNHNTNINYSYLTWSELQELDNSDKVEIQNHTYNMHTLSKNGSKRNGMGKMKSESDEEYIAAIRDDLTKMQKCLLNKSNITATAIAYPYGLYNKLIQQTVKDLGFKSSFLCEEKINTVIKGDEKSLFNLGRFNRPSGISTERFFEKMGIK